VRFVLAEKPSVARDIAKALGASKTGSFFRNGDTVVGFARGHLYEIADDLAPKEWRLEGLPILPKTFRYWAKQGTKELLSDLRSALREADEVVIATDPGREGELIARLILNELGWTKWDRTYRLWTAEALTPQVVRREMGNLKRASDFDSLYWAALGRMHADWVVGINYSRLLTLKARSGGGAGVWSVGRVQSPTLRLVVEREEAIERFVPEPYVQIRGKFQASSGFTYTGLLLATDGGHRLSPEEGRALYERLKGEREGRILDLRRERKELPPPLLHSLTSLQRQANALYGMTAKRTLDIAQKLYEEYKVISYPRTESRHLPRSAQSLVKDILEKLGRSDLLDGVAKAGKRVFDDSQLTDHHAIIPLAPLPQGATSEEQKVYWLVAKRFFAAFAGNASVEMTAAETQVGEGVFLSRFRAVLKEGWMREESEPKRGEEREGEGEEEVRGAVPLEPGNRVQVLGLEALEKKTTPPPRYTEGSLLKEMERLGLGTPATRAAILETLKERGYLLSQGKSLVPTAKGRTLIDFLRPYAVSSPEMTAEWERNLEDIWRKRQGEEGYRAFLGGTYEAVREGVSAILASAMAEVKREATPKMLAFARSLAKKTGQKIEDTSYEAVKAFIDSALEKERSGEGVGTCFCGKKVRPFSKGWKCEGGHVVWEETYGKRLSLKEALKLFSGERLFLKGLKGKSGKPFDAYLVLDPKEGKLKLQF
jgi:DNA topoisomerase-3